MSFNLLLPCKTSILFCSFFCTPIFLLLYLPFPTTLAAKTPAFYANETDQLALLAIKAKIIHDPFGILNTWNDSVHFCNWVGVTCGQRHQRVTTLNLSAHGLVGSLSVHIGNLTFLRGLNLELNHFHGEIPQQVGHLSRLEHLNLTNNSFSGEIPVNISACSNLFWLRLGFNNLVGNIPYQLGLLQKLQRVQLHYNNLTGQLPQSLGNLSAARSLSLAENNLEGNIPHTLGYLKNLEFLGLGVNQFFGIVPPSVYNISSMMKLSIPFNQLHGSLPSDIAFTLPNLQVLNVGHCQFSGVLPASLSNATNLIELDANGSNFSGKVGIDFAGTPNLWWLVLASNSLGTGKGDDLNFLNSLTKCRNLQVLDLSDNQFGGVLPNSLSNFSSLVRLRLDSNHLTGRIPSGIENLVNLAELTMAKNNLSGRIPAIIGKLQMLRKLDMSENQLSGHIPSSLANITQLYSLHLEKNSLTGVIPSSLGNLTSLQELDLSQNSFCGTIPKNVMHLSSLTISLNLARNQLTGSLPSEVGALQNLGYLDVSDNRLSGEIPSSLGHCLSLEQLHMESNFFEGTIPSSFSSLRGLEYLDLSNNNLSGQIPEFFQHIAFMNLNLSFNRFEGEVPKGGAFGNATAISIAGNKHLCGGIYELYLPACSPNRSNKGKKPHRRLKLMILLLSAMVGLVLIMSLLVIHWLRKMKRKPSTTSSSTLGFLLNVSYESLLKATDGFSSANLIGSGGFGSVYKGILGPNQLVVAVKVLYLQERGALRTFLSECEALRNIRHRNLVKLLTACSSIDFQGNDFKALAYEFMPSGSLQSWFQPVDIDGELRVLSLLQRLNIAIDVASALDYLHNHCQIPIIHCDRKPSNILLDNDLAAHVGDFGLARFISGASSISPMNQSSSVGLKGTVGYAAPEYGMGSSVSTFGDVYSYGILLLEIFTGKKPTEDMFKDGLDLHSYVKMALPDHTSQMLVPLLMVGGAGEEDEANGFMEGHDKKDQIKDCLTSILGIGVSCSVETPRERMDINNALKELKLIRTMLIPLLE